VKSLLASSSVESPDSFLETTKEYGEKVVESPGKLTKKDSEARLTKDMSLRKVDSVFPDNGAKMLSHSL
jgi:hypothetical protein